MEFNIWTIFTATPLAVCSIFAIALILERTVFYMQVKSINAQSLVEFEKKLYENTPMALIKSLREKNLDFDQALETLSRYKNANKTIRDEATQIEMQSVSRRYRKNFSGILTIAALAPMAGLLGTVVGLMRSFHSIGLTKGSVDPALLAGGLWQALSTTAAGLIIAGLCIFFHAVFSSKARRSMHDASTVLNKLSLALSIEKTHKRQ